MVSVKGEDLVGKNDNPSLDGEWKMVFPDRYYHCDFFKLSKYSTKFCIDVDCDYAFYGLFMWGSETRRLYPEGTYALMFEHPTINGININEAVGNGQDHKFVALTREECDNMVESFIEEGMIMVPSQICSPSQAAPGVYDQLLQQSKIEVQMMLNRILPEAKMSKDIAKMAGF